MKKLKDMSPKFQLREAFKILVSYKVLNPPRDINELKKVWDLESPHFNNSAPHRYESDTDFDDCCVYCLRPKNWGQK